MKNFFSSLREAWDSLPIGIIASSFLEIDTTNVSVGCKPEKENTPMLSVFTLSVVFFFHTFIPFKGRCLALTITPLKS